MKHSSPEQGAEIRSFLNERGIEHVKIGVFDTGGILRGKYLSRDIPFEPKTALFLGEFAGRAEAVCPRGTLPRVLERAAGMGYAVSAAAEFEFFVFDETPESVREKGYRHLKTMTPGSFGYSTLRSSVHSELYNELLDLGQTMRFPIEGLHTETGPGVIEAALTYCDALEAADRAAHERRLG